MAAARALLGRAGGQDCLEVFALLVKVKEQRAWCASESGIHLLPCDCSLRAPTWFVEFEIHGIRLGLHDDKIATSFLFASAWMWCYRPCGSMNLQRPRELPLLVWSDAKYNEGGMPEDGGGWLVLQRPPKLKPVLYVSFGATPSDVRTQEALRQGPALVHRAARAPLGA